MSVAMGSFQITTAENLLRSAYTSNGLVGHVIPNVGGRTSTIRTSVILDQLFQNTEEKSIEKVLVCDDFDNNINHENYNFLDCDWFKKLLFFINSLAKLLWDILLLDSPFSDRSMSHSHSNL